MDFREMQSRNAVFYRTLEEAIGRLPAEVRARLYRPCAEACVRDGVLVELRRQFEAGFTAAPTHCECSRQSILYVLEELLPGREIAVETLETVLSGGAMCRFRVTVGEAGAGVEKGG